MIDKKIKYVIIFTTISIIVAFFVVSFLSKCTNNNDEDADSRADNNLSDYLVRDSSGVEKQDSVSLQNKNTLPSEKVLDVQFIPQAPFKNWEEPWQNACEEAAVLTAYYYINNQDNLSNKDIKDDIQAMVDWQIKYFGKHKDLTVDEVGIMIEKYLKQNYRIIDINSYSQIRQEILEGNIVIIPAAGRLLKNKHFTEPAPIYHMLTIIGYNEEKIITNDPGTQYGEKFEYSYDNLFDAVHDWVDGSKENPDLMLKGKKIGIIIEKG